MSQTKHSHNVMIDAIGAKVVADRFGLSPQSLHNWRTRGIPALKRVSFQRFAAEHGQTPPSDFLAIFYDTQSERAA